VSRNFLRLFLAIRFDPIPDFRLCQKLRERGGGVLLLVCRAQRGTLGKMFEATRCNPDSDTATLYGDGKRAPMKFYTSGLLRRGRSRGGKGENHIFVSTPASLGTGAQICRIYRLDDESDWKSEKKKKERERKRERERERMRDRFRGEREERIS